MTLMDDQKQRVVVTPQTAVNGQQPGAMMGVPTNMAVPQTGMPPMSIEEPEYPTHILPGGRAQKAAVGMARHFQVSMYQIALEGYRHVYGNEVLFQAAVNFLQQLDMALAQMEWISQSRQRLPVAQKTFEQGFNQIAARLLGKMQEGQARLGHTIAEICSSNLADGEFDHRGFVREFFDALFGHDK